MYSVPGGAPQQQPYAANQYGAPYSPPPAQQAGYPAEGQSQQPYQQPYAAGYAPNQYAQPQYEAGYPQQYAQQPQASYAAPPQYAPAYVPQGYSDREQQQQQQLPVQHEGFSPIVSHEPSVGVGHGSDEVIKGLNYDDAQNGGGVTKKYNDVGFLVAFLLHLGAIVVLAIVYGTKMVRDINSSAPNQPVAGDTQKETSDNTFISILIVAAVIGCVASILWLSVMKRFSSQIIKISMVVSIALGVLGVIIAFSSANVVVGVLLLISLALTCLYYYFVRSRIPFATAILESSVTAIQTNSGPLFVVYALSVVTIGWLSLWAFTFAAVYHAGTKLEYIQNPNGTVTQQRVDNTPGLQFLQFFCVLSLYWTMQVLRNISHVTTSGVVASWWFQPQVEAPSKPAFMRAMTTSLGSICFASLVVALIQTARAFLRSARRNAFREIADCLLQCIERAVKWFNKFALSVVAIFGESFIDSASRTGSLLQSHLFTAVINDDLSGMVLFAGSFVSGVIAGIISLLWAYAKEAPGYVVMGLLGFIVGFLVAMLAMSVIESAVTATFVSWACDPAALQTNRPQEFGKIIDAGRGKYSNEGIEQYSGRPNI